MSARLHPSLNKEATMTILRIDHVGIAVSDLDEAIEFYAKTFGIVSVHVETNVEQGVTDCNCSRR
jgi:methylmalonyl-CoA/ethylmalonyl-CoA epimerase